jgi:hypothetical protein
VKPQHCTGIAAKPNRLERFLLAAIDAQQPDYIFKMFEAIKGRPPTPAEIATLRRAARQSTTRRSKHRARKLRPWLSRLQVMRGRV